MCFPPEHLGSYEHKCDLIPSETLIIGLHWEPIKHVVMRNKPSLGLFQETTLVMFHWPSTSLCHQNTVWYDIYSISLSFLCVRGCVSSIMNSDSTFLFPSLLAVVHINKLCQVSNTFSQKKSKTSPKSHFQANICHLLEYRSQLIHLKLSHRNATQ